MIVELECICMVLLDFVFYELWMFLMMIIGFVIGLIENDVIFILEDWKELMGNIWDGVMCMN